MAEDLWADNPELQARYNRIRAQTRCLQQELGIEPLTLEQRHQLYLFRKQKEQAEEQERLRQLQELERLRAQMPAMRPSIRRPR